MLRPDEIASIQAAVASFLPDLATLYASDAATVVVPDMRVRLVNDRSLTSMRNSSDFYTLTAAAGTLLAPGQVVTHGTDWYLVAKVSVDTAYTLEEQAMLLALPKLLTVELAIAPTTADGQRRFDNYGAALPGTGQTDADLVTTTTIHAALSNFMDMRQDNSGAGPVVTAIVTALVPLGSPIAEKDVVTVDGKDYRVSNAQAVAANGQEYGLQLLLKNLI